MNFDQAFYRLLGHEGGYVNHPSDPGGETKWGITKAVARAHNYHGRMQDLDQETAKAIYKKDYWDAVRAGEVPEAASYALFDAAVNSGVKQAVKWLQTACGTTPDGIFGPKTLAAVQVVDPTVLLRRMLAQRLYFMTDLKTWSVFGRGWARRIADLIEH